MLICIHLAFFLIPGSVDPHYKYGFRIRIQAVEMASKKEKTLIFHVQKNFNHPVGGLKGFVKAWSSLIIIWQFVTKK